MSRKKKTPGEGHFSGREYNARLYADIKGKRYSISGQCGIYCSICRRLVSPFSATIRFDASRRGKKGFKSSAEKNERHQPWWGGGKGLPCDARSELRLGGRENRRAKIINGMQEGRR